MLGRVQAGGSGWSTGGGRGERGGGPARRASASCSPDAAATSSPSTARSARRGAGRDRPGALQRPDAAGFARARGSACSRRLPHAAAPDRAAHERAIAGRPPAAGVEWICLAGYMRLLSPAFIAGYRGRILNIHPSLLPAFPGLHAQRQALEHGVRVSGCTVHLVDEGLDSGPIVVQRAVPVLDGDDAESLAARILEQEHQAYPGRSAGCSASPGGLRGGAWDSGNSPSGGAVEGPCADGARGPGAAATGLRPAADDWGLTA